MGYSNAQEAPLFASLMDPLGDIKLKRGLGQK